MALPSYDTTVLLAAIKRRAFRPTSDGLFSDADILSMADEEIAAALYPLLMQVRQEFFVMSSDLTISALRTADSRIYAPIPTRATAEALRDVVLVDGTGAINPVTRLEPDQLGRFGTVAGSGVQGYYLEDNNVVLLGSPGSYTTLRLSYFVRPGRLAANATGTFGVVASTTATTVTLTAVKPTTFTTSAKLDFISYTSRFQYLAIDQTPSSIDVSTPAAPVFTFTSVPSALKAGDFVALEGTTPVPQLPAELHPYLYQRVACLMMEISGENTRLERAQKVLVELEKRALSAFVDRTPGTPRKLVNVNGVGGVLNCGRRGYNGTGGI